MPHITTCPGSGRDYEEASKEDAQNPGRICASCLSLRPRRVRVQLRTVPGMYTQYDQTCVIRARSLDADDIFHEAVRELRRTGYTDYNASMWKMLHYEVIED